MKFKRWIFMLLIAVVVSLTGCSLTDEPEMMVPTVEKDLYVYDQGDLLEDSVEKTANQMLVQLEQESTIEFAVITIPSLNGIVLEDYAVDLGNELGIGKEDENNGILLLISKEDERVRLEIGDGLQSILTDSISGRLLDNFFVPHRENDDYDTAVLETIQSVINVFAASEEYSTLEIEGINKDLVLETHPWYYYLIIILVIILIVILIEWVTGHIYGDGFGDGFVFAILSSEGGSGYGSGGFSSGGFGGGGFSGGGASR